jgi:hypothetical protein
MKSINKNLTKNDEKRAITNSKMGNQIYFKIALYVDLDMLQFFAI